MTPPNDFRYRLIYEQLSRFSGSLSRTNTLDEVRQCLHKHAKYLFDFDLIRLGFYEREQYVVYSLTRMEAVLQRGAASLLTEHERLSRGNYMPTIVEDAGPLAAGVGCVSVPTAREPLQLWSWDLALEPDSGVVASVYSRVSHPFRAADMTILKLMLETLHAKLRSIRLVEELTESQRAMAAAMAALQEKNELITQLTTQQDAVIQRRTRELELKNTQLLHLSRQHAHTIREPLARILSLTYLTELLSAEEIINDVIPHIITTSSDLDTALRLVIEQIDAELRPPDQ